MEDLQNLLQEIWRENGQVQWTFAGATALSALLVAFGLRGWIGRRHTQLAATERVELLELPLQVASKTSRFFLLAVSLLIGAMSLKIPSALRGQAWTLLKLVSFWQLGIWGTAAVIAWLTVRRRSAGDDRAAVGSLGIIGFVMRVLVWGVVLLLALDNVGIDVTALVAGLGVGGIAVALAVQNVLGDLFASLSITLDRPFEIGDFIIVGDYLGSVEQIGVKSTRLRSLGGEQIILSNADILNSRIRNYKRMQERRVVFALRVTYETPRAKLKRIPAIVRAAVERHRNARFDRCHFATYGEFSFTFETVFYVLSADYNTYMDVQQAINLDIHEAFEKEQIDFAYPTQRLWLTRGAGNPLGSTDGAGTQPATASPGGPS